jgi:KUP system potassium uptake protein
MSDEKQPPTGDVVHKPEPRPPPAVVAAVAPSAPPALPKPAPASPALPVAPAPPAAPATPAPAAIVAPPAAIAAHDDPGAAPQIHSRGDLLKLGLAALGVVYGDIGTSPLYTIKECFIKPHGVDPTAENVLGVLCLVFWALLLAVIVKYLTFVMRADNRGEGGIMALLALIMPKISPSLGWSNKTALILLALFGTALLFADGMITPAITVISAVEGLEVATSALKSFVVPISVAILVALFLVQKRGTAGIGAMFGPAMVIWFFAIAALGAPAILRQPTVLQALLPWHGVRFFNEHGGHGFLVLGAVVLCITGTEALYADMGHFGPRPIRFAWYRLVYPALLLNYFGQGAIVLERGEAAATSPFFALSPTYLLYPVVAIATIAAIIASQALISGSFSLAQQAMQLGYSPRLHIIHTSSHARGQIYVPGVNTGLMLACCGLVLAFRSSTNLAAAYGLAVTGTMAITSVLIHAVMRERWGWSRWKADGLLALFLCIDLPFFLANLYKVAYGGWFPLVVGALIFSVLTTWKRGRAVLAAELKKSLLPIDQFMPSLELDPPARVKGTAVFMTSNRDVVPPVLLHHFRHNKVLHEQVILLYVVTESVPDVPLAERVEIRSLTFGFYQVVARYGFMQNPNVPQILERCVAIGLNIVPDETSYYLGRETLLTTGRTQMSRWRKALFVYLSRNARPATSFFGIPPNRVVEMGMQVEL